MNVYDFQFNLKPYVIKFYYIDLENKIFYDFYWLQMPNVLLGVALKILLYSPTWNIGLSK